MRKKLSMMMAVVLLCSIVLGNMSAVAAESGQVSAGTVSGKPGDTVEVEVTLDKNPGIIAIYFAIGYDSTVLKLESVKNEGLLSDYMSGSLERNPFSVSWEMATAEQNSTKTGTLLTLSFTILDNAAPGDYEITLTSLGEDNIYDINMDNVPFTFANGTITVNEPGHTHVFNGKTENIKNATCTEDGLERVYCSVEGCNEYKENVIKKKGHVPGEWTEEKEAGCTENGVRVQKCTECGLTLNTETIPMTGHKYGEWTIVKEPAIGEPGEQQRVCAVCGNVEKQSIPAIIHGEKDHVFDGKEEILEQAPPEQKESLQACFLDLRRAAEQLQVYNAKAMEIAQANLAFWESTMHKEHLSAPQQVTYSAKKGSAPSTFGGSSFQTKV